MNDSTEPPRVFATSWAAARRAVPPSRMTPWSPSLEYRTLSRYFGMECPPLPAWKHPDVSTFPRRGDLHKGRFACLTCAGMSAVIVLDPLLSTEEAAAVVDLWHDFPTYGLYSNEGFPTSFAPELSQRYDAAVNFV